jgi:hypothetical protein
VLSEIVETPGGDYRYRAWATRDAFATAMSQIALELGYANFKEEVARRDPKRASIYGKVWSTLRSLQPGGPYGYGE